MKTPKSAARKIEAKAGHWKPVSEDQLSNRVTSWDFRLHLFRVMCVGAKSILLSLEKSGLNTLLLPLSWLMAEVSSFWTVSPRAKKVKQCLKQLKAWGFFPRTQDYESSCVIPGCARTYVPFILSSVKKKPGNSGFFHFAVDPDTVVMGALPKHMHLRISSQ